MTRLSSLRELGEISQGTIKRFSVKQNDKKDERTACLRALKRLLEE